MTDNASFKGRGGPSGPRNARDNLFSADTFEFVLGISEGPIGGLFGNTPEEKLQNVFINNVPIFDSENGDNFTGSEFLLRMERGTSIPAHQDPDEGQTPIWYQLGGSTSSLNVGAVLSQGVSIPQLTPVIANGFDEIDLRFSIQSLVKYTDDGTRANTLELEIRYRLQGTTAWTYVGNDGTEGPMTYQDTNPLVFSIAGKTTVGGYVRTCRVVVPKLDANQRYELEVKKLSPDSDSSQQSDVVWAGYELTKLSGDVYTNNGVTYDDPTLEYHPGTAMLHVSGVLGQEMTSLPNISAVWQGILCSIPSNYDSVTRTYDESSAWDGQFKVQKAVTDNPFWIAHELITNPEFGLAKYNPRVQVNRYKLYELAKYADGYNPTTGLKDLTNPDTGETQQPRYTFNGALKDVQEGTQAINYVLGSAFSRAIESDEGEIIVVGDIPSEPVATITPEMCLADRGGHGAVFQYSYSDITERHNCITSSYIDAKLDWQEQQLGELKDEESIQKFGLNTHEFPALGCLTAWEVWRKMYFYLMTVNTEVATVTFRLPVSAIAFEPFDIVNVCDPDLGHAASGRAIELDRVGNRLRVRDPIYFAAAGTYTLELQAYDQTHEYTINVAPGQVGVPVVWFGGLVGIPSAEDLPAFPVVVIKSSEENSLGLPKPYRILAIAEEEGTTDFYTVVAHEVNMNKFTAADNMEFKPSPKYSFQAQRVAYPVKDLQVVKEERTRLTDKVATSLWVSWDRGRNGSTGVSYEVSVSAFGAEEFKYTFWTSGTLIELPNLGLGDVLIQVTTHYAGTTAASNQLEWVIERLTVQDLLDSPEKLSFSLVSEVTGKNVRFVTKATYDFGGVLGEVDIQKLGDFAGVRLRIYDNVDPADPRLLRQSFTVEDASQDHDSTFAHEYEYPRSLNKDDSDGALATEILVRAEIVDRYNSVASALAIENTVTLEAELLPPEGLAISPSDVFDSGGKLVWADINPKGKVSRYVVRLYKNGETEGSDELILTTTIESSQERSYIFPRLVTGSYHFDVTSLGHDGEVSLTATLNHAVDVVTPTTPVAITVVPGLITVEFPPAPNPAGVYEWRYSTQETFVTSTAGGLDTVAQIPATIEGKVYYFWFRLSVAEGYGEWVQGSSVGIEQSLFTWVAYADDAQGTGISLTGTGKPYIGLSWGHTIEEVDTQDPSIFQWLKREASTWHVGESLPTAGIGSVNDKYLHSPTGDVYSKTTPTTWTKVGNIRGDDGDIWHSGNGVPSAELGSDGDWYLDLDTFNIYNKQAGSWFSRGSIKGDAGPQGVPGTPGQDGVTLYTWIRFADNAAGGGISNDPAGKAYIGFSYNQPNPIESNDPADYIWSKVQGEQGNQGVPGTPGEDGQTYWTWIKYSANADGAGMTDLPQADTVYIGIAINQTEQAESTNPADYTWSQWRGEDGAPGQPGTPGARGNLHLYQATTGTTWNNAEASAAFADFGGVNNADRCTLYNTAAGYSETKGYSDSSGWFTISQVIDGNLLVNGSITANKIDINDLYSRTATISGSLTVGDTNSGLTITGGAGSSYIDAKDGGTSVFRIGKTAGTSFISGGYLGAGTVPWAALSQEVIDRIGASVGTGGGGATTGGVRSRSIILAAGTHALTSIDSNGQTVTLNAAWGGWTHQRTSAPYSTPSVTLEWLRDGTPIKTKVTSGTYWTVNEGGTTWHYQEMPAINWNESDTTPKASGSTVYSLRVTVSSFTPTGELTFRADQPVSGGGSGGGDWDSITNKPDLIKATAGTYWGLSLPDGTTSNWLRTTSAGLIPQVSGGGAGVASLGTADWPFFNVHANNVYGGTVYEGGTALTSKYLPKAGGTLTGALAINVGDGQQLLSLSATGGTSSGIRRKGSNHGIVLHADDGLMLHSGDTATRDAYIAATGIGAGTNEIMHIVSDDAIYISPGQQSGYTTAGRLVVSTSGITWNGKALYHAGNKPTAADVGLPGLTKPLAGDALTVSTTYGTVEIGMRNSSWCHFYTYTPSNGFYFNKRVDAVGRIGVYGSSTYLTATQGFINNNLIYHAGNKPTASDVGAVQQGGGTGQGNNKVYIGWNGTALALQVDSSNFGNTWPINITGGAGSATSAGSANKLTTARTINGVAFDGTANITISAAPTAHGHTWAELSGIPVYASRWPTAAEAGALASNGTAVAANKLATARTINGVLFDGTANITVTANPNAHYHNASDINTGTLADARLPTTMSGKSFTSAVSVTGTLTATGVVQGSDVQGTSDIRVKTDLKPITNALSKLRNLNGYTYYRTDIKKVSAGLIAQDLQRVLPEGVSFDGDLLHISQMAPIAILIEAVKELERKVEALH